MWNTCRLKAPSRVQWFIASQAISVSRPVDRELGELGVLDAVRPAPEDLPGLQRGDVGVAAVSAAAMTSHSAISCSRAAQAADLGAASSSSAKP